MSQDLFDIIAYLEDRDIEYWLEGPNCSEGWVNIQCPFCDDHSNHCGIHLDTKAVHCWRCGKHKFYKLIMEIDGCSKKQAIYLINNEYQTASPNKYPSKSIKQPVFKIDKTKDILPKECTDELPDLHRRYLKSRGFDPDFLVKAYHIKACYNIGKYKFRLIVPIFYQGYIVNFIARDVTGQQRDRYRACPDSQALIPLEHLIYNIDNARDKVILVEGVFDVWRIGPGAVASFGIQLTDSQLRQLTEFDQVTILFDSDAKDQADNLANQLAPYVSKLSVLYLKEGFDPADLSQDEVLQLRKEYLT